jgi:hypothetical protein
MTKNVADLQQNKGGDAGKSREIPASYTGDWIQKLDGRTAIAKAIQDRLATLEDDLGGRDSLSYQQHSLCKRIVWLEALIESREAALARGDEISEGAHTQQINALVGLLKTVGLDRKARDVPDLQTYLRNKAAAKAEGGEQ